MKIKRQRVELKCPVCEKKNYYYRIKSSDYQCRSCGSVFYVNLETYKIEKRERNGRENWKVKGVGGIVR